MNITLAQINPTVGDLQGNLSRIEKTLKRCEGQSDLVVFPELSVVGYPPLDLLHEAWFLKAIEQTSQDLLKLSAEYPQLGFIVGTVRNSQNVAVLYEGGKELACQAKSLLPSYDVFDEQRYFQAAQTIEPVSFRGLKLGLSICEDAWTRDYASDPLQQLIEQGAQLIINLSASPFQAGKDATRLELFASHAQKLQCPVVFVNQVGANDELIFDGHSFVLDANGDCRAACAAFEEDLLTVNLETLDARPLESFVQEELSSVYKALVLGLRDYCRKCSVSEVLLGLSGGIDSALTATIASEALGPDAVWAVTMPSKYSSQGSVQDSVALAANLGIHLKQIPIEGIVQSFNKELAEPFAGTEPGLAEENLQARVRGNLLMSLSNKFNRFLLSTGNKSELAVGYCTLYGDMCGALSVIGDVPKMMVYDLARYINRNGEVIPQNTIDKPPSAELRENQSDQDSLPEYDVLDKILCLHIEEHYCSEQIVDQGFEPEVVDWVLRAVRLNEYKRRQGAPVLRVTSKAFGFGRRMPIAARYS